MSTGESAKLTVYTSAETHTWVQKAADLFGLGTDAIRWIEVDDEQRMRMDRLRERIAADREAGFRPFIVIGTGGRWRRARWTRCPRSPPVPDRGIVVPRGRRVRCAGRARAGGAAGACRVRRGGFRRRGPAQVAVCAARGGVRARPRAGGAARRVLVSPVVLPLPRTARIRRSTFTSGGRRTRGASVR